MWEILTFAREQPYESSSDEKVIANLSSLYSAGNAVMVSANCIASYCLAFGAETVYFVERQHIYIVHYDKVPYLSFRFYPPLSNVQEKFVT